MSSDRLNLSDLKAQSPKDLLSLAEELEIENASTMRKGDMMFSILKERAEEEWVIGGRWRSGSSAGRFRLSAFTGGELPSRPGRHLCLARYDPAVFIAFWGYG